MTAVTSDQTYVKIAVRIYLSYNTDQPATNVNIVVSTPAFVHAVPKNVIIQKVNGLKSTPVMIKVNFYAFKGVVPSSLESTISASYLSVKGEPRIVTHSIQLPLFLACKPKPPMKNADCKIVLDTELPAQSLTELFDDFLYAYQESVGVDISEVVGNNATQAMGFQLYSNSATIFNANNNNVGGNNNNYNGSNKSNNISIQPVTAVQQQQLTVASILVSKNAGF
jgi:hypothetical protein